MRKIHSLLLPAALLGALGAASLAQIKSMTLEEMVQTADQAVYGQIVASHVSKAIDPADGMENYFTTLTLQGTLLPSSEPITVDVSFRGGFISETEGVFNSEAPAADDVKIGNKVVAFYRWSDDLGGLRGNTLVAAHGGIYRTVQTTNGPAVLGRGQGYAITSNRTVGQLSSSIREIEAQQPKKR